MVKVTEHGVKAHEAEVVLAQQEAPEFEKVEWKKEPHLRKLYFYCGVLMVASATTGYDGMLINTIQQIELWEDYFTPQVQDANLLGLLVNMFNIGSILSLFITPFIADKYGRRLAIGAGCLIMVLGGCLSAFATSYAIFITGRFFLGFGNGLAQMSSPLLLTEICHPQHRGPVTAVYNCLWNADALLVAWIGWGTAQAHNNWSWRSITLLQVVPSVTQLVFIYWIPESPRWLMSKDRREDSLQILSKYHGGGNSSNLTVQFEYREIKETIKLEAVAKDTTGYIDFFRTKGNRWRLAIIISVGVISQYSGNALFSNYMNTIYEGAGITNQNQKLGLSGGKTILDLVVTITAAMNVDRFGRRPLFLISAGGMVCSFVLWTICGAIYENSNETNSGSGYAQLVWIWMFGVFYDIGFSGLLIAYSLEILPFELRAKGMMIMNITVQAILALGNQTNVLAWNNLPYHWNFMLFYTLWDTLEFIFVYFVYVETNGPTLEEVAKIFDGEDAIPHLNINQIEKELHSGETEDVVVERHTASEKTSA
ncbi:general substrate transporter [Calycina marina]|uniref:General substrate transporter n=1 Tax=Calycina marina TaxID=1763456 RepID=A0A9P8CDK5_9HELO|nr:general substrate transporter [Calycina marina]